MMDHGELVENIQKLIYLDIDAIEAYKQALVHIEDTTVYNTIDSFRQDHLRHVKDLSQCLAKLGQKAPDHSQDFKGFFIEGFTALRSLTGTKGALKAMKTNEGLTTSTYGKACLWDCPSDVKQVIETNFKNEQRHLSYIESCLGRMENVSEVKSMFDDSDGPPRPRV